MPGRTRASVSTATELIPPEDAQSMAPGLQFNETLSWKAGKAIPVAELLRRLQALSTEMRDMEQEENERETFLRVAKELASPNLMAHKDKGVKAWTACCLVDILRLCAPDAPYTAQQLKDIFSMIIMSILPALSDPSNAYNTQHMYVLESLATVKSIVLVTDLPSSESLILNLFTSFFDVLSSSSSSSTGEQLAKNIGYNMTAILVILVDEAPSLPQEAVDTIIAQFLRVDPGVLVATYGKTKKNGVMDEKQSTLVMKELPPAYNMAKTICNSCPEKMAREISKYFNDVILDATPPERSHSNRRGSGEFDDLDEAPLGPSEEDMKELHKAHQLLRELWRASPAVLQNVIPQLETELSVIAVPLRRLAVESLGDIISGIGAAGPPPPPIMDPAAYPPSELSGPNPPTTFNLLTTPSSPQPFSQVHPHAYASFLNRRQDKSAVIRSAWTTGVGRILATSAGGVGLSQVEEQRLVDDLARMLNDADEKVRIAAVKAVGNFGIRDVINRLGSTGSVEAPGSVLGNLSERVKDRKHSVRVEAMKVLGRMWAVAVGEIVAGNEQVISTIGAVPSKILNAYYANDLEINVLLDSVFFEYLLPLSYPPIRAKSHKLTNGSSQRVVDSQANENGEVGGLDPDKIRTERILLLAKSLDERAKKVFFAFCSRQAILSKYMTAYLQGCEEYNGGVMDKNETPIKEKLTKLINELAKFLPEPSKVASDLWKFAKMHDRRSYQLIRFSMAPESDYRTVLKANKEFAKRIETSASAPGGLLDTLTPLLYRASIIIYNKSHVPTIMEISKSDEKALGGVAHEVLKDISARTPEILKTHVQEICRSLQEEAPAADRANSPDAVNSLKACAAFAQKFPTEIPQDRKFVLAMTGFALYGSPPEAAKHAVSIIMATSQKKDLFAKDVAQKCVKGFEYGSPGFLSRLAALSQLMLLAPAVIGADSKAIIKIAKEDILLQMRTSSTDTEDQYVWSTVIDEECAAKCWALKILVNYLRSYYDEASLAAEAEPVYEILSLLVANEGELSAANDTPPTHKPHLRLLASRLCLKLCTSQRLDGLLSPSAFNKLAEVAQDSVLQVRTSFLQRLKKYSLAKLPARFYTIPFLVGYEPVKKVKEEMMTWIKSRALYFSSLKNQSTGAGAVNGKTAISSKASTLLEAVFARLLSLLAYHSDYGDSAEDLLESARYIIFYLSSVASEDNISLIYHIAQRVKGCRDAISSEADGSRDVISTRLYALSDLGQLIINSFTDAHSWSLQTLPTFTKATLPRSLFTEIKDHEAALEIAEQTFLPPGVSEGVEKLVRNIGRKEKEARSGASKKRKSEGGEIEVNKAKKAKTTKLPVRSAGSKSTKKSKRSGEDWERDGERGSSEAKERRKSGRVSGVSYVERDDSEDDQEMEELNRSAATPRTGNTNAAEASDTASEEESDEEGASSTPSEDDDNENSKEREDVLASPPAARTKAQAKHKPTPKPKPKPKSKPAPALTKTPSKPGLKTASTPKSASATKAKENAKPMATKSPNTRATRATGATTRGGGEGEVMDED